MSKECGFKIETQNSPKYEYGRGKEYQTREEARAVAERAKANVVSQINLEGYWRICHSVKIIEDANSFMVEVKYKTPIFNF